MSAGFRLAHPNAGTCGQSRFWTRELGFAYRLPIDVSGKIGGMTVVAEALERGDVAKAQVAMFLTQFRDRFPLGEELGSMDDLRRLAGEFAASGLLKEEDFETKHPRPGTAPNRGWFATKPQTPKPPIHSSPRWAWPSRQISETIREWVGRGNTCWLREKSDGADGDPGARARPLGRDRGAPCSATAVRGRKLPPSAGSRRPIDRRLGEFSVLVGGVTFPLVLALMLKGVDDMR